MLTISLTKCRLVHKNMGASTICMTCQMMWKDSLTLLPNNRLHRTTVAPWIAHSPHNRLQGAATQWLARSPAHQSTMARFPPGWNLNKNQVNLDSQVDPIYTRDQKSPGKLKVTSMMLTISPSECQLVYTNTGASQLICLKAVKRVVYLTHLGSSLTVSSNS